MIMIELNDLEIDEVSQLIFSNYQVDFRNYAKSSLSRRYTRFMSLNAINSKLEFLEYIKNLKDVNAFVEEITVNTTEMFRDPSFWVSLKNTILPTLNTHENVKIWHAGCSSGEEVVSMQILLRELGMENKVTAVASDIDLTILEKAKKATYSNKNLVLNEANYKQAGGKYTLQHYVESSDASISKFKAELLSNVTFKKFDLVKDTMYTKFDLILCRNVLIYFDFDLQERVISKFVSSLFSQGFVAIGQKESIISNHNLLDLKLYDSAEKIYRFNR